MKRYLITLSLTVCLAAATTAFAAGTNPTARGDRDSFGFGAQNAQQPQRFGTGMSSTTPSNSGNGLGRTTARFGPAVSPVPEPSEWALLLAGLALVGYIVRRNSKR
jgi:hypothetical protein